MSLAAFMGPESPTRAEQDRLNRLRTGTPPTTPDATPATPATPATTGTTLTGYDLSSNNSAAQFTDALAKDLVIVKASEGVSYKNPTHDGWVQQARGEGLLVGHYHYARPESNGPEAESKAFLAASKAQAGDVLVLDFEPPSILPVYPSWVVSFGNAVTAATGAPSWLYTNQSQGNALVKLAGSDQLPALYRMPLWKAYYQSTIGDLMGWPDWACWQYTSTPIDTNRFNGDAVKWRSLGVPGANMADATLSADTIKAIATAAAEAVYAKSFAKQPPEKYPNDTTSLKGLVEWRPNSDDSLNARVQALAEAIAALPKPPTAAEIAAELAQRLTS